MNESMHEAPSEEGTTPTSQTITLHENLEERALMDSTAILLTSRQETSSEPILVTLMG